MARKAVSNDRYRLVGTYERLRRAVLQACDDEQCNRALSYWVLPSDRRLPIAFLDQSLSDLLELPLDDLMRTPGVGQKKILGFFDLLRRIAKAAASDAPFGLQDHATAEPESPVGAQESGETPSLIGGSRQFDAAAVSEALWSSWCDTVRHNNLSAHRLGRLAPSLRMLPTVIWNTPLSFYTELSLAEIRRLKTHGEKRVFAILEVFSTIHEALSTAALHENLDLELTPRFVPRLTRWLTETAWADTLPPASEVHNDLVKPLVQQIDIDLGAQVAQLAADRLQVGRDAPTVKQQAVALGVTRARVYQLLEDCGKVMDVRWPEGRWLLASLMAKSEHDGSPARELLEDLQSLFFPDERPTPSTPPASRRRGVKVASLA